MTTSLNALSQTITELISSDRTDTSSHPVWNLPVHENLREDVSEKTDEFIAYLSLLQLYGEQASFDDAAPATQPNRTLPERFAALLLNLSAVSEAEGLIKGVNFQEMATALNTYRETIASLLRAFRRQGMVEIGKNGIQIVERESLIELSGEPPLQFHI